MVHPHTHKEGRPAAASSADPRTPATLRSLPSRSVSRPREELQAESEDPYVMGWDAAGDLDNPPPCPWTDGLRAKLWRKGFADRVQSYIADRKRHGGLAAAIT